LILVDTNYCNYPDTLIDTLRVAQNVKAQFQTPSTGCAPYEAVFVNTSLAGSTFVWDFGDGSAPYTGDTPPPHLYADAGTYTITLTATDPNTCNVTDTYSATIVLQAKPTGSFTYTPNPPVANTPTVFAPAGSSDVVRYKWLFGDGDSTSKTTADTVVHQYQKTATFTACLIVFNASGCTDTVCQDVAAIINPLLDVPNAFTPGRFGQNGIIKVVGFGIMKLNFRIYNRWGQLVFQSNDQNLGWDGTYRGALQPMDVYAYTLDAEFSDGTHVTKKGDITLIR
jgi:gliding motility-associated-like protein